MIAGAELSVGAAAAADSALLLEDNGGAEEDVGARKPLPRRKPVQWEKLENKEVVLENRKLRGDLHRLELEIAALRTQVDRQMEFKDQELTDAHKQLAAHRGQPSSAALTAERAHALAAEAHGTGGVVGRVAAAADEAWVQDRVELNEDLRLYASLGDMGAVWHALRRGADINEVDDEGNTALLVAVRKNQSEVVGELLKKGADFSVANRFNQNAMSRPSSPASPSASSCSRTAAARCATRAATPRFSRRRGSARSRWWTCCCRTPLSWLTRSTSWPRHPWS